MEPVTNFVPLPYRRVAVRRADFPLTDAALRENLLGREAYRRTEFIVLRRAAECAVARIEKASADDLFSPITFVEFLAPPAACRWADDAAVDVGNPSALAAKARALGVTGDDTLVVHGKYEHVNFICRPEPVVIRVVDVIPPEPAKLWTMANQALAVADYLPATALRYEPIDLTALARAHPAPAYLFPCQASGIDVGAPVYFLDTRPPLREWTMVGCERCAQLHRRFYGREAAQVDFCPRRRIAAENGPALTLTKCCLLETDIETRGHVAVVPWGGNFQHVLAALTYLSSQAAGVLQKESLELIGEGAC